MTSHTWGSTAEERARAYPCDNLLPDFDDELYRAVDVAAPGDTMFRWLCQMRAAPYSYDWLDNNGRRSPPHLVEGLDRLAVGQTVMSIFRLASFDDRDLTMEIVKPRSLRLFGAVVLTYQVREVDSGRCRVVVKVRVRYGRGLWGRLMRWILPVGDLVMMRKQLLTLKHYADS